MKLLMYGLNVDNTSDQANYFYQLNDEQHQSMLSNIFSFKGVEEVYLFQNQHSFEVYLFVDENSFKHGDLLRYLANHGEVDLKDIIYYSYSYYNLQAINHLFDKVYGTTEMSPIEFFNDFIYNSLKAHKGHTLGRYFQTLFNYLLSFMFNDSVETQTDYHIIKQLLNIIQVDKSSNYSEKDILILGANLDSLYLSYCLKHYGVNSVTLTEINDSNFIQLVESINQLDLNYLSNLANHNIKLIDMNKPNYQFAVADVVVNLVIGWSNLKEKLSQRISEIRLTPKKVTYAAFYLDDFKSQFDEFKLTLPKVSETTVRQEEIQESVRMASENTYQAIFDSEN